MENLVGKVCSVIIGKEALPCYIKEQNSESIVVIFNDVEELEDVVRTVNIPAIGEEGLKMTLDTFFLEHEEGFSEEIYEIAVASKTHISDYGTKLCKMVLSLAHKENVFLLDFNDVDYNSFFSNVIE